MAAPLRFIASGALVTGTTFVLYVLLQAVMPYPLAYTLAFVVGVAMAYALNRTFVFRVDGDRSTLVLFPLVYVVQYGVGLVVVFAWVSLLDLPTELASLAAVAVAVPITYLLSRWVFVGRRL